MTEVIKESLDAKTCAEVALYMYNNYKEEMKPPVYSILSFEDWLHRLIDSEKDDI